jgi:hypothetical protein
VSAADPPRDPVGHAINHDLRKQMVELLWHSSEPLTAEQFQSDFVHDDGITLAMIVYHVRQLDRDGIVHLGDDSAGPVESRPFVLDGPNSGEAVRRIPGLTGGGSS